MVQEDAQGLRQQYTEEDILRNIKKMLTIISRDSEKLAVLDDYKRGKHADPYMPQTADDEYKLLAKRCVTNWMPLIVSTPLQAMYVDGYVPGNSLENTSSPQAWEHWQRSRLDAKQSMVYDAALSYGHAYVVTTKSKGGKAETRGLSTFRTTALFEDPANDITPKVALTITRFPNPSQKTELKYGKAKYYDETNEYDVLFENYDIGGDQKVFFTLVGPHGAKENPVTRFAVGLDLDGNSVGLIEPMIILQDRLNQCVFDLLIAQTDGSFQVRWSTGMAPPVQMRPVYVMDGDHELLDADGNKVIERMVPVLDETGKPKPLNVNLNAKRFIFAENPEARLGAIPGAPLDGYLKSIESAIRQMSAISQMPPHHVLGEIANLSAEALQAAETSLHRKVQLFRTSFGESWERVFQLAAQIDGYALGSTDFSGEVRWRDMENAGLAKAADAVLKLKEVNVPAEGLWDFLPGVTDEQKRSWKKLIESDPDQVISSAMQKAALALEQQKAQAEQAALQRESDAQQAADAAKGQDNAKAGVNVSGRTTTNASGSKGGAKK